MFAETRSPVHETYCLRRADVAFFRGNVQITASQQSNADHVEDRFRGSKGDQLRKRAVLTRVRCGPALRVGDCGITVYLIIELMSCYLFLPSSAPPCRFWRRYWQMVHVGTAVSNDSIAKRGCVGGRAGGRAEEYALHSLRIGGVTHLSAGGGDTRGVAA